nr:hypothetical protein BaRGS_022071 [Batillaria attramentaria]
MILRDILPERPDLKIILMSATLNAELFSSYFYDCPMVEIPGRYVVEDNSPYAQLQKKSSNVSGKKKKDFTLSYADAIEESLMGLSLQAYDENDEPSDRMRDDKLNVKQLMARYPDCSKRTIRTMALMDLEKINYDLILLLLEWIVSGDHSHPKEGGILIFLPGFAEIQTMLDTLLSSSEFGHRNKAKYRIVPLHSTLSSEEQNAVFAVEGQSSASLLLVSTTEIQRVPLEQLMIRIKMLDMFESCDAMEILSNVVEPPSEEAMENALCRLQDVGALDEELSLTALGYHLGSLPVDVRLGKLMLFGAIFRCLDSALTIAAALSFKSPFVSPFSKKDEADEKRKEFAVGNSDYLTILNAYKMLANLKQQYVELLSDIGFTHKPNLRLRMLQRAARETGGDGVVEATGPEANIHSKNWKLISAILVGALYPNVVQVMTPEARYSQSSGGAVMKAPNAEELRFATKSDGFVHVHPSSVNFPVRHYESPYLVYHEKVKTSKVAELLKELRLELDKLLEDKISNPNMDLATCPRGSRIISTIVTLITTQ